MTLELPCEVDGATGALIGVVTQTARVDDSAVLIVPAPGDARTGAHRLHVRLARALAQAGLPSLRYDAAGGGDCPPATGTASAWDGDAVAAAHCLLGLYPHASLAVLALGDAAAPTVRAWPVLAAADVPLASLCLIDPAIGALGLPLRRKWWRRPFGAPATDAREGAGDTRAGDTRAGTTDAREAESAETRSSWLELPRTLRATRSKLFVAAGGEEARHDELFRLAHGERAWRKALRRSDGWLHLRAADEAFSGAEPWRTLCEWLGRKVGEG